MGCNMTSGSTLQSWIIRLIHRYSAANFCKFTELGIHPGQLPVLGVISDNEGINQRDLARAIHIKPPTVAVTVKRLEKAGLVFRKADPADMRISRLYLSDKGRNVRERMKILLEENEKILTTGFSDEELCQARMLLSKMVDNLKTAAEAEK
ncbi:MAG: MarR family transcriptional regulator [Candidatus Choladocola sp.]|nr:MarR family transcriptional regulator [Candidatus Choladocola sp.]